MNLQNLSDLAPTIEVVTGLLGTWYGILKIFREIKKAKKTHAEDILARAEEKTKEIEGKLISKINLLEIDVENLKASVKTDISNLKDNHAIELKNLSERIDNLREELRQQHTGILTLLTKLVEK